MSYFIPRNQNMSDMRTVKNPEEIREILIAQGLTPSRYRKFLEVAVKLQHENFNVIAPLLTDDERVELEMTLMQGELGLMIVSRACY